MILIVYLKLRKISYYGQFILFKMLLTVLSRHEVKDILDHVLDIRMYCVIIAKY